MPKFTFNIIYRDKSGEIIDDENVWINARDKLDAFYEIKQKYPKASDRILIKSE